MDVARHALKAAADVDRRAVRHCLRDDPGLCRQRILRLHRFTGSNGGGRCALGRDPNLIRTNPATKRPFQGWRYLAPADAPADLSAKRAQDDALPPELAGALADIGVL